MAMTYLTSGPLMSIPERRKALIEGMAADLVALGPSVNDDDALLSLVLSHKYQPSQVMALFDAAKYEAEQMKIAAEMTES